MLPLKWKIFRIMIYLHMTGTAFLAVVAIAGILQSGIRSFSIENLLMSLLFMCVPIVLLSNSSINLLLLERYYPHRLPGKVLVRFNNTFFVLSTVIVLLLLVSTAGVFIEFFSEDNRGRYSTFSTLYALTLAVITLTGGYIVWCQVNLRRTIRRNHDATINNFLTDDEL